MDQVHHLADPIPDRAMELKFQELGAAQRPEALAESSAVCAELDRYDIDVVLQAVYEWGGYRYTHARDAVAAAKRARK